MKNEIIYINLSKVQITVRLFPDSLFHSGLHWQNCDLSEPPESVLKYDLDFFSSSSAL